MHASVPESDEVQQCRQVVKGGHPIQIDAGFPGRHLVLLSFCFEIAGQVNRHFFLLSFLVRQVRQRVTLPH